MTSLRITCSRKVTFDSAHRVMEHESKCRTLHGHTYKAIITASANGLDSLGRIIDFSVLKEKVGGWIDNHWDHTTILSKSDVLTIDLIKQVEHYKDVFVLPYNPTAENMAKYLITEVCPSVLGDTGISVTKIILWETPNCFAEVSIDD